MWLKKHRNSVNGAICIVIALVLLVSLVIYGCRGNVNDGVVSVVTMLIAMYAFTRGLFTIVLSFKEKDLGLSVFRYVRIELYNQLFFVYERMLWVWFLLPMITVCSWFVVENEEWRKLGVVVMGSISILLIAVFTQPLIRKKRCLRKRIKEIENDLVETNASS